MLRHSNHRRRNETNSQQTNKQNQIVVRERIGNVKNICRGECS